MIILYISLLSREYDVYIDIAIRKWSHKIVSAIREFYTLIYLINQMFPVATSLTFRNVNEITLDQVYNTILFKAIRFKVTFLFPTFFHFENYFYLKKYVNMYNNNR